jgi:hypothetical protein
VEIKPVQAPARVTDARDSKAAPPLWLKDPRNDYWFEYLPDQKFAGAARVLRPRPLPGAAGQRA